VPRPESIVPDLDPAFASIISKAMARDMNQRFQTAQEFREAVEAWLERGQAVSIPPTADPAAAALLPAGARASLVKSGAGTGGTWATSHVEDAPVKQSSKLGIMLAAAAAVVVLGGGAAFALLGGKKDSASASGAESAAPLAAATAAKPAQIADPSPPAVAPAVEPAPVAAPVASAAPAAVPSAEVPPTTATPPAAKAVRPVARPAAKPAAAKSTAKPGATPDFGY
jgi:hypothetical protein